VHKNDMCFLSCDFGEKHADSASPSMNVSGNAGHELLSCATDSHLWSPLVNSRLVQSPDILSYYIFIVFPCITKAGFSLFRRKCSSAGKRSSRGAFGQNSPKAKNEGEEFALNNNSCPLHMSFFVLKTAFLKFSEGFSEG